MDKNLELSKKLYNQYARKYLKAQKSCKNIQDIRNKVYSNFLTGIKNKKILFAGCGNGLECELAVKGGAKVVGIDISDKQIKIAEDLIPKAEFFNRDIKDTKFKKKTFDIIISINSVMYEENLRVVFKELKRILKDNGYIVLLVPHPNRKMMKYNKGDYFVKGKKWEVWAGTKRFNFYRLFEDYVDEFSAAGLKLIKLLEPRPVKENKLTSINEMKYPYSVIFKLIKD